METYRLQFFDDGLGEAKTVEFDADDAAKALIIAHVEAKDRSAQLWKGKERLCVIRRSGGIWQVSAQAPQDRSTNRTSIRQIASPA